MIDLNADLWARFKEKVKSGGKTLTEVVPTVFEPALQTYLEPKWVNRCDKCGKEIIGIEWLNGDGSAKICGECFAEEVPSIPQVKPPPIPTVKRCELCDKVVEKLFRKGEKRVCYPCWSIRDEVPTNNTSQS